MSTTDDELLGLSMFLEPRLGHRLRQLIDAESRVHQVIDLEQRTQRAEDLATECRRQLRVRDRQVTDLERAARELASEAASADSQTGGTDADRLYRQALRDAAAHRRLTSEDQS
ncbi:hypothetical protein [Nocardioides sp.]|uniref:hypothetical protein n=1 Tax=Nocardioides sp. TaxID=35761 RepID=UPI0026156F55|nr:hypothetical protein [Nocardioides sp.]MDI6911501.1 hypothetical protein [Nocardioides sp.]